MRSSHRSTPSINQVVWDSCGRCGLNQLFPQPDGKPPYCGHCHQDALPPDAELAEH
ncbi:MAG: hypothetical protein WCT27_00400 [Patescibacteria group bacterium]